MSVREQKVKLPFGRIKEREPRPVMRLEAPRLSLILSLLRFATANRRVRKREGFKLTYLPGVCEPAPSSFLSLAPLFRASVEATQGAKILEVGAGGGLWGLMQLRAAVEVEGSAQLTITELPEIDLSPVSESARSAALPAPEALYGDLFEPLQGRHFDLILFNPPFHHRAPQTLSERAYCGGERGETLRRFLSELPAHLAPTGVAHLILPQREGALHQEELSAYNVERLAGRWLPLLGTVELLELRNPRGQRWAK